MSGARADGLLRTLSVEGFGLIDHTAVDLGPGLNIFTGETGSGKSMVMDALTFVFGARAGPDVVRAGSTKAVVTAEVEGNSVTSRWLSENGFEGDAGEPLVLSREMQAQGRSSARINGKPATAGQLRELGDLLLDVVGQHEHTRLAQPSTHREVLDAFAGAQAAARRETVASLYVRRRELHERIAELERSEHAAARALADARYAADEIRAARLVPGEIEELVERRSLLAHAAKIAGGLAVAVDALDEGDHSAVTMLGRAASALDGLSAHAAHLAEFASTAKDLQAAAADLRRALGAETERLSEDPAALDAVEERLALIERLQKKYGRTVEDIVAAGERFAAEAERIERRDVESAELRDALAACETDLERAATTLNAARRTAAAALDARVNAELRALGMRGAVFRCAVDPADEIGAHGADRVEFFAALNPNEPERPIARSASGGELARLLLALKVALAAVEVRPIVVLDEIDAGIGGAAARAVGARIAALSGSMQVLCVTHLAQIAAYADRHVRLEKKPSAKRVTVAAEVLEQRDALRAEIARMLSGDETGSEALRHAEALLRDVKTA